MEFVFQGVWQAIQLIFSGDAEVLGAAWRSLWISTIAVTFAVVMGVPLGACLGRRKFFGHRFVTQCFRTAIALPTVFIGLVCYSLFARSGPLGPWDLLYTPWAIVLGEVMLALPIIVTLTQGAVASLDERVGETSKTLGVGSIQRFRQYVSEAHVGIKLGVLTAFARCVTELGIAMMVGGNLKGQTRTLSTATALETSKGEFETGMAMGLILLMMAMLVTVAMSFFSDEESR